MTDADEAVDVERAVARRHSVAQAVVLVVGQRRRRGAVTHLHPHQQLGRNPSDQVEIVGAASVMPDVGAHAAVGPCCGFDDGEGIGGVDDVGERQELQADGRAVLGRSITQLAEAATGVGDRSVVWADRLDVRHTELLDQRPHERLEVEVLVARCRAAPPRQGLDLGHRDTVSTEQLVDPSGAPPVAEQRELPGEEPDAVEPRRGRRADPIVERMVAGEGEVGQDQLVPRRSGGRRSRRRGHRRASPASSART